MRRIYASINASVFMLNQIERRYIELEALFLEYDAAKTNTEGKPSRGECAIDIGYPKGNYMVSLAWDLADWCEKLRKVLSSPAGLKKKTFWYSDMLLTLEGVETVRHFAQHYDKEIKNFVENSFPLMGSVYACFSLSDGCYTRIIPSNPIASVFHSKVQIYGVDFPEEIEGQIGNLHFSIEKHAINLTELIVSLRSAASGMKQYLLSEYNFSWPEY